MSKISSFLNEQFPLSNQNKRLFCAYHNSQFLTNFCLQKQCLMPLCPSCIVEHTQQHFQQGKKPIYLNLNEALNKSKQDCYYNIIVLTQYKKLNQDIYQYIASLNENIHFQLEKRKQQVFQIIQKIFKEYEIRLLEQVYENYKEKNVYDKAQAVNANKYIQEEINNLYEKISLLKSDQCLTALITYHAVDQQGYTEALSEFDEYFQKNRKAGKIEISIVDDHLKKVLTNFCDHILTIQSIIENYQKKPEDLDESNTTKSKRYGFNKGLETSEAGKISRRIFTDKQNQQNNYNKQSPNFIGYGESGKPTGKIVYHFSDKNGHKTNKDQSFNAQNQTFMKRQDIMNEGRQQNLSRKQISTESVHNQSYGSKRLTRDFKKQV